VALQVPFMAWMGTVPVMGGPVQRLLAASARPVASLAMAATGAQFFLDDAAASAQADPLLVRAAGAMRPGTGCLMCRPWRRRRAFGARFSRRARTLHRARFPHLGALGGEEALLADGDQVVGVDALHKGGHLGHPGLHMLWALRHLARARVRRSALTLEALQPCTRTKSAPCMRCERVELRASAPMHRPVWEYIGGSA